LISKNFKVEVVTTDSSYSNAQSTNIDSVEVDRIKSFYEGKNKFLRLIYSVLNSFRLIRKARNKIHDVIIVMSDPPFLTYWASKLLKDREWFFWSMDLYPDAFIASNLVSKNNPVYRYLQDSVYSTPPDYLIALGSQQASYLEKKYDKPVKKTILPCGIHNLDTTNNKPYWKDENNVIYLGYCGNIGSAHSIEFVQEAIIQSDNGKFKFILSVYGENAHQLNKFASDYDHVIILDHVKKENLKYIDIHLVTLKERWEHVCVPSKAVSAICSECTILYCGTKQSDSWKLLGKAGWYVDVHNIQYDLITHFEKIDSNSIEEKILIAKTIKKQLIELKLLSFKNISEAIKNRHL
jgi:hypothetical protein